MIPKYKESNGTKGVRVIVLPFANWALFTNFHINIKFLQIYSSRFYTPNTKNIGSCFTKFKSHNLIQCTQILDITTPNYSMYPLCSRSSLTKRSRIKRILNTIHPKLIPWIIQVLFSCNLGSDSSQLHRDSYYHK